MQHLLRKRIKEVSFPFMKDFALAAIIESSNRMILEIRHLNAKKEVDDVSQVTCIHTVVSNIPYDVFIAKVSEDGFYEDMAMKHARSLSESEVIIKPSEKSDEKDNETDEEESIIENPDNDDNLTKQKFELSVDEAFFALQSWVQGIAEAGIDAFKLNFEVANNRAISVLDQLLTFVLRYNADFLYEFIDKIHRECRYEGVLHESSLIANYNHISNYIYDPKAIEYIYDQDITIDIILRLGKDFLKHPRYCELFIKQRKSTHKIDSAIDAFLRNDDAGIYPEILDFFNDEKYFYTLMQRKDFFKIDEIHHSDVIRKVFNTRDTNVLEAIACRPQFCAYADEFKKLFAYTNCNILNNITYNSEAIKFPEFENLFQSSDIRIIMQLLSSDDAYTKHRELYRRFFTCTNDSIIREIINHPFMYKDFPNEFRQLFNTTNSDIRIALVRKYDLIDIYPDEYFEFFYDFDSNIHQLFMENPKIINYPQIKQILAEKTRKRIFTASILDKKKDDDDITKRYPIITYGDIAQVIDDPTAEEFVLKSIASSSVYPYHVSNFIKIFESAKTHDRVKTALLSNVDVMKLFENEFSELYDQSIYKTNYKTICEKNPSIRKHPNTKKYMKMENEEMDELFNCYVNKNEYPIDDFNIFNFPIEYRIKIAENPNLIDHLEFKCLVVDPSIRVKRALAANPSIHLCEEVTHLFRYRDMELRINLINNKAVFQKYATYYHDILWHSQKKVMLHAATIDYIVAQHIKYFRESEDPEILAKVEETIKRIK